MTVILSAVGFWAPITFARVGDDHKPEIVKFRARFKHLKKSERRALDRRLNVRALTAPVREELQARIDQGVVTGSEKEELQLLLSAVPITDAELLNDLLVDWDLKDREGGFIPYTLAVREEQEEALDGLEAAIVTGYFEARREAVSPEAIAKNSEAPSATS